MYSLEEIAAELEKAAYVDSEEARFFAKGTSAIDRRRSQPSSQHGRGCAGCLLRGGRSKPMAECTDIERELLDSMTRAATAEEQIIAQAAEAKLMIAKRQAIDRSAVLDIRRQLQTQLASIKAAELTTASAIDAMTELLGESG